MISKNHYEDFAEAVIRVASKTGQRVRVSVETVALLNAFMIVCEKHRTSVALTGAGLENAVMSGVCIYNIETQSRTHNEMDIERGRWWAKDVPDWEKDELWREKEWAF